MTGGKEMLKALGTILKDILLVIGAILLLPVLVLWELVKMTD